MSGITKRTTPFPITDCPTRLLGFATEAELEQWVSVECPRVHIVRQWLCGSCQRYHYQGSFVRTARQAEQAAVKGGLEKLKEFGRSL